MNEITNTKEDIFGKMWYTVDVPDKWGKVVVIQINQNTDDGY